MKHTEGEIEIEITEDGIEVGICGPIHATYNRDHSIMKAEAEANAERIAALWNAFNGIPTHDAMNIIQIGMSMKDEPGTVKYIEHGAEMEKAIISINNLASKEGWVVPNEIHELLTKLEADNG